MAGGNMSKAEQDKARQEIEESVGQTVEASERSKQFNVVKDADLASGEKAMLPESWDDAFKAMESIGAVISRADEDLADEFPLIDKKRLVNVECLFLTWTISDPRNESYGSPYIIVRGIRRVDGKRFRFVDGSTGVAAQLIALTRKRIGEGFATPNAGLHCPRGLNPSTYQTVDGDGNEIEATTFYIDNQPAD